MLEKIAVNYLNNLLKKHGIDIYLDIDMKELENGFEIKVKVLRRDKNGTNNK